MGPEKTARLKEAKKRENFLVFGAPSIEEPEIDEVLASMRSGWLGTGPKVAIFEHAFKAYKSAEFAAAVNSCTAALHLSLLSLELDPGDEVITSPMTFCATINAIIHSGATPVLADVESDTMNIDPKEIESKITPRTKAILPIHFAGRPCNMDAITDIAQRRGLKIVEDCAHAIESEYKGKKIGTFGEFGCFSFYVTKNIVTGEGGMVLAKNEQDINRIKMLALHGMTKDAWKRFADEGYKHYLVTEAGYKYNMMDMQAAIGIHQLKRIEPYWHKRREIWQKYNDAFADLPVTIPAPLEPNTRHAYHLYTIMVEEESAGICRDRFIDAITDMKIGIGVHYLSIPEHPYYHKRFGWKKEDYPNSYKIGRKTVSLPLSASLSEEDTSDVITAVKEILA